MKTSQKIRDEFDNALLLNYAQVTLLLSVFFIEMIKTGGIGPFLLKTIFFFFIYRMLFRVLRHLYYSYWSFTGSLSLYALFELYSFWKNQEHLLFYLMALYALTLLLQMMILFSPIFYPRARWWEYDFRYRDDLKVKLGRDEESLEDARLTDLRRNAGCLESFQQFRPTDRLLLQVGSEYNKKTYFIEVMCKRPSLVGRPFLYGVKFHLKEHFDRDNFDMMKVLWKRDRMQKKELKKQELRS